MVWLVLGVLVVESGEVLFGELEFTHVGFEALLLESLEVAEEGYGSQLDDGYGKGTSERLRGGGS